MITFKKAPCCKTKKQIYNYLIFSVSSSTHISTIWHQVTAHICKGVGGFKVDLFNPQAPKLNILLKTIG